MVPPLQLGGLRQGSDHQPPAADTAHWLDGPPSWDDSPSSSSDCTSVGRMQQAALGVKSGGLMQQAGSDACSEGPVDGGASEGSCSTLGFEQAAELVGAALADRQSGLGAQLHAAEQACASSAGSMAGRSLPGDPVISSHPCDQTAQGMPTRPSPVELLALLPAPEDSTQSTVALQDETLDGVFREWADGMQPPAPAERPHQPGWVQHGAAADMPDGGYDMVLFMGLTGAPVPQQHGRAAGAGATDSRQPAPAPPGSSSLPTPNGQGTPREEAPQRLPTHAAAQAGEHEARLVATAIAAAMSPEGAPAVAAASVQALESPRPHAARPATPTDAATGLQPSMEVRVQSSVCCMACCMSAVDFAAGLRQAEHCHNPAGLPYSMEHASDTASSRRSRMMPILAEADGPMCKRLSAGGGRGRCTAPGVRLQPGQWRARCSWHSGLGRQGHHRAGRSPAHHHTVQAARPERRTPAGGQ